MEFYNAPIVEINKEYATLKNEEGIYTVPLSDSAKRQYKYLDKRQKNWCQICVTPDKQLVIALWDNKAEMINNW